MKAHSSDFPMLFHVVNTAALESLEVSLTEDGELQFLVDEWICNFIDGFIFDYVEAAAKRERPDG